MILSRERGRADELVGYVDEVAAELGLGSDNVLVETGELPYVYLALEQRMLEWPDHDVALLWDEVNGWSVAIEADRGLALVRLYRMRAALAPSPSKVADFVSRGMTDGFQYDSAHSRMITREIRRRPSRRSARRLCVTSRSLRRRTSCAWCDSTSDVTRIKLIRLLGQVSAPSGHL